MSEIKLMYFNLMGLAEPIRTLLSYLDKEFEDFRFEFEDWPKYKPDMPFGKVPVLEMNNKVLHQSIAICRYLGTEAGLAGKNSWENLQIDIMVDTINDYRIEMAKAKFEPDPELKEKKMTAFKEEITPYYLTKFEGIIKDNGGYIANGKLSWGDFYVASVLELMSCLDCVDLDNYPNCKALKQTVMDLPKVKAWIEKRPKTDF